MPNWLRNTLALIAGVVIGGFVNMGIIMVGPSLIPVPAGMDVSSAESIKASMPLLRPQHFITPFVAHAMGTLVGALVAHLLAATHRATFAYVIGVLTLCGGIAACFMIPAPMWFMALDLIVAYLPMAWLATVIGQRLRPMGRTA